jgi:uncharacterized protein
MIRLLMFAFIFYLGYRVLKYFGSQLTKDSDQSPRENVTSVDADLIQDPQCGIYFLKQEGVEARVKGQTIHFCSEACRSKFLENK